MRYSLLSLIVSLGFLLSGCAGVNYIPLEHGDHEIMERVLVSPPDDNPNPGKGKAKAKGRDKPERS